MIRVQYHAFGALDTTCYLVTDDSGARALVDCADDGKRFRKFLGKEPLDYILLTHGHFDHIANAETVAREYGAKIVISKIDAPMLTDSTLNLGGPFGAPVPSVNADITVEDGDILPFGNAEIHVIATPGHTPGSVTYQIEQSLFTGDTLMSGTIGRTDYPGGSPAAMKRSLKHLITFDRNCMVYPGHGNPSTIAGECAHNPFLLQL